MGTRGLVGIVLGLLAFAAPITAVTYQPDTHNRQNSILQKSRDALIPRHRRKPLPPLGESARASSFELQKDSIEFDYVSAKQREEIKRENEEAVLDYCLRDRAKLRLFIDETGASYASVSFAGTQEQLDLMYLVDEQQGNIAQIGGFSYEFTPVFDQDFVREVGLMVLGTQERFPIGERVVDCMNYYLQWNTTDLDPWANFKEWAGEVKEASTRVIEKGKETAGRYVRTFRSEDGSIVKVEFKDSFLPEWSITHPAASPQKGSYTPQWNKGYEPTSPRCERWQNYNQRFCLRFDGTFSSFGNPLEYDPSYSNYKNKEFWKRWAAQNTVNDEPTTATFLVADTGYLQNCVCAYDEGENRDAFMDELLSQTSSPHLPELLGRIEDNCSESQVPKNERKEFRENYCKL